MEINLKPDDIRIDSYSSAASSGFSFRVSRGVRVTHIPTGLSVTCESERSQHRNKAVAIEKLKEKLNHGASGELSMTNLLPCPFCGSDVEAKKVLGVLHIVCLEKNVVCSGSGLVAAIFERNGTYDDGIKAWNTRTEL